MSKAVGMGKDIPHLETKIHRRRTNIARQVAFRRFRLCRFFGDREHVVNSDSGAENTCVYHLREMQTCEKTPVQIQKIRSILSIYLMP